MKIVIVTDAWLPQVNGVVTTLLNVIDIIKKDHTVTVVDPSQFFTIPTPRYPELRLAINPWKLRKKLDELEFDAIHIATEGPLGLFARNYCEFRDLKYTTSYHTDWPNFIHRFYKIPKKWTAKFMSFIHRNAEYTLTTTQGMKNELEQIGLKNLMVWGRGVDSDIFNNEVKVHRGDKPLLITVNRVSFEKNIEAFCELAYNTNYDCVVVGDGPARKSLEKKYPSVDFVGYKKGKELAKWYAGADVMVFPSKVDTFGLVMIEAMSCGTPVAGYPVRGPIDVIDDGETGFMHNSLEIAVEKCIKLKKASNEFATSPITRIAREKFTWNKCAEIFVDTLVNKNR